MPLEMAKNRGALNDVFGGVGLSNIMGVAIKLLTLDMATRAIGSLKIPGLPPFVPSLITTVVAIGRLKAVEPLTAGLPSTIRPLIKGLFDISTIQIAFAQLPALIQGITATASGSATVQSNTGAQDGFFQL